MTATTAAAARRAATQPSKFSTWYGDQRGRGAFEVVVLFLLLQSVLVVWYLIDKTSFNYLSAGNLGVMTQSGSWLAMLAIGSGIVMMVGEIDLSVGANMGMSSLVFLTWYQGGNSAIVCVLVAIATGMAIGVVNALVLNYTKIPSLISTLGMMSLLWGLSVWYTGGDNMEAPRVKEFNPTFEKLMVGDMFGGVHAQFAWVIGVGIVMWVAIHRHRIGNHISAVGGNEQAARAISINPNRVRIYAFAMLGLMCAVGGIMVSVQTKTLLPGSSNEYNLPAITAAVIGGTAVKGGKGSVLGMILGTFILKAFQAIVLLSSVFPAFYLQVFTGGMLILFATANQYFENKAT
jgi:simple sugar transport system permease protein